MTRLATRTVVALGGLVAVVAVASIVWSTSGSSNDASRPPASAVGSDTSTAGVSSEADPLGTPPAVSTTHGELVAVGMQEGTRYAFRLRVDATGITKCSEPTPGTDHPDCRNNGSSELPVLSVFGSDAQQWVWATLPTHRATHPQLWIRHTDGTLTVVPLEAHGRLAWPAAAVLLRGDERSAELRDGAIVLNTLYLRASAASPASTSTTTPSSFAVLLGGTTGDGPYELDADTSVHGRLRLCLGDLAGQSCVVVTTPTEAKLLTLSDPHGAGLTLVIAVVPPELADIAHLWVRIESGVMSSVALQPLAGADIAVGGQILPPHHGEVELRIGPTIAAALGADR